MWPRRAATFVRSRAQRPTRPGWDESGFTLVELLVALMVLGLVLISIAYSLTSAMTNVGYSRQQQAATGLANKAIEEARGLPYSSLTNGSNDSDPTFTSDTAISFGATDTYNGETLVHSTYTSTTQVVPLFPHASQVTVNRTTYTVRTYVTHYAGVSTEYRITSVVTWTPSDRAGATNKVTNQTVIFSPANGCLSPNTHPYAAPCQPYFESTGTVGQGYIQIGPKAGESDPISGIPFTNATLYLPRASSNISLEQIATLLGGSYTSGASINAPGSSYTTGQVNGAVQASNDPGSNTAQAAVSNNFQGGTPYVSASSGSSNPNTLQMTPAPGDTGYAVVTAAAGTATTSGGGAAPACDDLSGTVQNTNLPCGQTTVQQSGSMTAALGLYAGSQSLGNAPLATVAQPTYTTSSGAPFNTGVFVGRYTAGGGSYCPNANTSGNGCVHSGAQRQIGAVSVGGLPQLMLNDGSAPAAWKTSNYLFQLSNYSDSAFAESGVGTLSTPDGVSVPAAGQTAPVFTYWTGTAFTTLPSWPSSATNVTINPFTITDTQPDVQGPNGALSVTISANLTIGGSATPSSGSAPCASSCTQSALTNSPVKGDVFYTIDWNNTVLADLDIHVDLGSLEASTAYQEAPGAG